MRHPYDQVLKFVARSIEHVFGYSPQAVIVVGLVCLQSLLRKVSAPSALAGRTFLRNREEQNCGVSGNKNMVMLRAMLDEANRAKQSRRVVACDSGCRWLRTRALLLHELLGMVAPKSCALHSPEVAEGGAPKSWELRASLGPSMHTYDFGSEYLRLVSRPLQRGGLDIHGSRSEAAAGWHGPLIFACVTVCGRLDARTHKAPLAVGTVARRRASRCSLITSIATSCM